MSKCEQAKLPKMIHTNLAEFEQHSASKRALSNLSNFHPPRRSYHLQVPIVSCVGVRTFMGYLQWGSISYSLRTLSKSQPKSAKVGLSENRNYILLDFNCLPYLSMFKYITWRNLFSGFNLWIIIDQLFKARIVVGISHPHTNFAKTTPKFPKVGIQQIQILLF